MTQAGFKTKIVTHNCLISDAEEEKMQEDLHTLRRVVEKFPVADLHVRINRHDKSDDFHVKTSLHLPGRTLFTGDRDAKIHPAYERCVRKLVKKVTAYKDRMSHRSQFEKQGRAKGASEREKRARDSSVDP